MPSVFQFMVSKSQTVELQEVDVDFMTEGVLLWK